MGEKGHRVLLIRCNGSCNFDKDLSIKINFIESTTITGHWCSWTAQSRQLTYTSFGFLCHLLFRTNLTMRRNEGRLVWRVPDWRPSRRWVVSLRGHPTSESTGASCFRFDKKQSFDAFAHSVVVRLVYWKKRKIFQKMNSYAGNWVAFRATENLRQYFSRGEFWFNVLASQKEVGGIYFITL